eukprot:12890.XXX_66679_66780_1 [CDS] Oithona nana genome sequencing.
MNRLIEHFSKFDLQIQQFLFLLLPNLSINPKWA